MSFRRHRPPLGVGGSPNSWLQQQQQQTRPPGSRRRRRRHHPRTTAENTWHPTPPMSTQTYRLRKASGRKEKWAAWRGSGACRPAVTSSPRARNATPPLTSTSKQNALPKSLCSTRQKRPGRAPLGQPSFPLPPAHLPSAASRPKGRSTRCTCIL